MPALIGRELWHGTSRELVLPPNLLPATMFVSTVDKGAAADIGCQVDFASHRRLAQHWEPALAAQSIESALHYGADVGVDLVDVGVIAELGDDVDRLQHLGDDFRGQRHVGWEERSQTERETHGKWQYLHPYALEAQALRQPIAAGQEQLGFLPPDRHRRHDRHTGLNRGPDISCTAVEVDDVLGQRRPKRVIVPAGK